MKTHCEFTSPAFPAYPDEDQEIDPGRYGRRLAEFIAASLRGDGYAVKGLHAEDWGWAVTLDHVAFPLWVGCGNLDGRPDTFLCFIEPSKPILRRLFRKIETAATVEALATALQRALEGSGKVSGFRWWTQEETGI